MREVKCHVGLARKIFTISQILGTFPFTISSDKIRLNYVGIVPVIAFILLNLFALFYTKPLTVILYLSFPRVKIASNVLKCGYIGLSFTPVISVIRLYFKLKRLSSVFQALGKVQNVTSNVVKETNLVVTTSIMATVLMIQCFGVFAFQSYPHLNYLFTSLNSAALIVVQQFTALLKIIRCQYGFLLDSLDRKNAETWAKCHEVLGSCCTAIMECYAPQILLFFLATFVMLVSRVYMLISLILNGHSFYPITFYTACFLYQAFSIYYVLFSCRDAILKAKKFDRVLYRMVITDDTEKLIKNRRIQVHFKEKRIEEFSPLGFINLDYKLICSMVSTATTYLVILVQFSR